MSRVLMVAPPYAGHLNPILALASGLRERGDQVRIATGSAKAELVRRLGFGVTELIADDPGAIAAISDTSRKVGSNPVRLLSQLRANLALVPQATAEVAAGIREHRAEVVVSDFTALPGGIAAQRAGIGWITTMPTPFALETRRGVPSYLGGWRPREDVLGRVRDAAGRLAVRAVKRSAGALFAGRLRELGVQVYRGDGTEGAYSPQAIAGLGLAELEFARDWPSGFELVGPVTASPEPEPGLPSGWPGEPVVLASVGTHLPWVKARLAHDLGLLAGRRPEVTFVISNGDPALGRRLERLAGNLWQTGWVDYDQVLPRCVAVIHHGGAGVSYSALRAGLPSLVWPQDYDQFDFAARIEAAGVGRRTRSLHRPAAAQLLDQVLASRDSPALQRLQQAVAASDPVGRLGVMIDRLS